MKKIIYFYSFTMVIVLLLSCKNDNKLSTKNEVYNNNTVAQNGTTPYLTTDQNNIPVLCWTVQDSKSHKYYLSYSKWNKSQNSFGEIIEVKETLGMQKHKESMGKIAYKSDGTTIVAYGVSKPIPENKYAGYVAYTVSTDNGKNWSKSKRLVAEDLSQSQRFFDLARLPDGEVGMSWLDYRKLEPKKEGSSLYFGKTDNNNNFSIEKALVGSTCQCCRTDIFVDSKNTIHIAFRDIIRDTIRDMKHTFSLDTGKTFSDAFLISEDNWVISGCPHTGPSIAENKEGLAYAWFTLGGGEGIYFAKSIDYKNNKKRKLISSELYHPQMIGIENGYYLLVGEETASIGDIYFGRIVAYFITPDGKFKKHFITDKASDNSHALIAKISKDSLLIAWTKHKKDNDEIDYTIMNVKSIL